MGGNSHNPYPGIKFHPRSYQLDTDFFSYIFHLNSYTIHFVHNNQVLAHNICKYYPQRQTNNRLLTYVCLKDTPMVSHIFHFS